MTGPALALITALTVAGPPPGSVGPARLIPPPVVGVFQAVPLPRLRPPHQEPRS